MRPATLLSLALLGLVFAGPVAAAPANKPSPPTQNQPQGADADDDDTPPPSLGRSGPAPRAARSGDRKRRSYAFCNRELHKRNLRGGARRRFLIRCKLGYERRQPAAAPSNPPQPGKRP